MPNKDIRIELTIPKELNDKDSVFGYCVRMLRKLIGNDEDLKGTLKPFGDIQIMTLKDSLVYLGLKSNSEFYYYQRKLKSDFNKTVQQVNSEDKHGPLFLKEDLAELLALIKMSKGKINLEDIK